MIFETMPKMLQKLKNSMKSGIICRPWREKSMKNDRKVTKIEEKVFLNVKNSQQSYKVIGVRVGHLIRRKVTTTPLLFESGRSPCTAPAPLPHSGVDLG